MTRKHFQAIADAMKMIRPWPEDGKTAYSLWGTACNSMADVCAAQNGRFNRARFLTACGVE